MGPDRAQHSGEQTEGRGVIGEGLGLDKGTCSVCLLVRQRVGADPWVLGPLELLQVLNAVAELVLAVLQELEAAAKLVLEAAAAAAAQGKLTSDLLAL